MASRFARLLAQAILAAFFALFGNALHAVDVTVQVGLGWNLLGNTGTAAIDAASVPELFDAAKVATLWKWNSQASSWVFYAPSLASAGTLASYASGKGYEVLSGIAPGEGFWVNAAQPFTLSRPGITAYSLGASTLVKGWNLLATGDALSPAQLDAKLGGAAAAPSFTTMWAWDGASSSWYFYAPSLAANSTLAAYIASKGYRDFGTLTTDNGLGFWLNSNVSGGYTPNPISVSVSADAGRAASKVIDFVTGGVLVATGADGTVYTLTIPPGALLRDQTVTLTPVSAVSGFPFSGGLIAAAHIAPEGLHLMVPATLEMQLAAAPPESSVMGFAYTGSGEEFYLHPHSQSGATLTLSVEHFSGPGAGSGTAAERDVVTKRDPSDPANRAQQQMADRISKAKSEGRFPSDDELEPLYREWYNTAVKPDLTAAETDDSKLMCAAASFLIWHKEIGKSTQLESRFAAEVDASFSSLGKGFKSAFDKSFQRCVANNDPAEASVMVGLSRQASFLEGTAAGKFLAGTDIDTALQKARKCSRFEVVFDSRIDMIGSQSSTTYSLTSGAALVQWDPADSKYTLKSDLVAASESESYGSTGTTNTFTAQFGVNSLKMNLTNELKCRQIPRPPPFEVELQYHVEAGMSGTPWWTFYRSDFHSADYAGQFYDYKAADFIKGSGGVFAQKTYSKMLSKSIDIGLPTGPIQATLSEQTEITIKHVPLP